MFSIIEQLIKQNGIASANISVKPHGDSIAVVVNLNPDHAKIADEGMRQALMVPIVLIGQEAVDQFQAEVVMKRIQDAMQANSYLSSEALAARLSAATPKAKTPAKGATAKASTPTVAAPTPAPAPAAPASADDIFAVDSL